MYYIYTSISTSHLFGEHLFPFPEQNEKPLLGQDSPPGMIHLQSIPEWLITISPAHSNSLSPGASLSYELPVTSATPSSCPACSLVVLGGAGLVVLGGVWLAGLSGAAVVLQTSPAVVLSSLSHSHQYEGPAQGKRLKI